MQNFELVVVENPAVLAELGAIRAPVSPLFIVENTHQLAQSPEELTHRPTDVLATSHAVAPRTAPHVRRDAPRFVHRDHFAK